MVRRFCLGVLLLLIACAAMAQQDTNGDGRVTVLVPLTAQREDEVPLAGAHGSLWTAEIWLRNGSSHRVFPIQDGIECHISLVCGYEPGRTEGAIVHGTEKDRGALLVFAPEIAPHVGLSARLLEHSRRAQPNGIEIPVVWEDEFLTKPTTLVAIPRREGSRVTLRVYAPRPSGFGREVRVEALKLDGGTLGTTTLYLDAPTSEIPVPNYAAILDVGATFPLVQTTDRFDLRITPLTPGTEFWAFASETDRDTQHVLLITPDQRR